MPRSARFATVSLFVLVLGCGALGCGSSSATHHDAGAGDAGTAGFQGGFTGTGNVLGTGGSASGTAGSGGTISGTGGTITPVDAGPPMPTGSLVFQGTMVALLNQGPPCTGEAGATGDRWCGFFTQTQAGSYPADLYVVDVTKAAAGTAITCGATDANCLHLTDSFTQDAVHAALFQGDTLVYYDGTWTPFAWRPGMTAGRALATADPTKMDVLLCLPDIKGTAVVCLRDLPAMTGDPAGLIRSDLLAGRVDDAATPPLARIETVISVNPNDTNVAHFQIGFPTPGGDTIAWSARATPTGPEILKMQTLGNDASRVTVASGVNSWQRSREGALWIWISGISDSTGAGTLQSAPYPAGTSPTNLATNVVFFGFPMVPSGVSLVVLDTGKNLRLIADPVGAPTTALSIDTGVIGLLGLTAQGYVAYGKAATTSGTATFANMFVKKADGTGACTVTSATDGYVGGFEFTPDSTAATWIQRGTSAFAGRYTRLSDCTGMTAEANIAWIEPLGSRGVLLADSPDSGSMTVTLRLQAVAAGNTLSADAAAMISGQVGGWFSTASAGTDIVVYTVNGGGNDDGIYVRGFGP
jgi:hypothetical protein